MEARNQFRMAAQIFTDLERPDLAAAALAGAEGLQ